MFKSDFQRNITYYEIQSALFYMLREKKRRVLNIHIHGTGCTDHDGRLYPNQVAFDQLKHYLASINESNMVPMIFLEGVAGSGEDYVAPIMRKTNTLENKQMSTFEWLQKSVTSTASLQMESWAAISKPTAYLFGKVSGSGMDSNNKLILKTLSTLQKDNVLPDEIFLSGYSRGAVNCISLAYEIYLVYGQRIKIHLCLLDPVPGPMHEGLDYIGEKVIAPNVISFTCFYAPNETRTLYVANDLSRLVFANPNTTITSMAIPDTDHTTIVNCEGDIKPFLSSLNCSSVKDLDGISPLFWAVALITFAVNGYNYEEINKSIGDFFGQEVEGLFDQQEITGLGPRESSHFFNVTALNEDCSPILQSVLSAIRAGFDINYLKYITDTTTFQIPEVKTYEQRRKQIRKIYKSSVERNDENTVAHLQIRELSELILCSAKSRPPADGQKWIKLKYRHEGIKKSGYFTEDQHQQLEIINKTASNAGYDPLHPAWFAAIKEISMKWPDVFPDLSNHYQNH